MSQAMVDRLFWRAGFGPSAADRAAWIGKPLDDAVDALLNTPQGALLGADGTRDGKPLDPNGDDTDLVLAWLDRMVRTGNPLVERMTFFWHRHWANSRQEVSPTQLITTQNALLRKYGDSRRQPGRLVPRDGARDVRGPLDAAVPERRVQREGRPERELWPRAHGALRARRDPRRHGREELHRERRAADREGAHRLVHRRPRPEQRAGGVRLGPLVQRPEVDLRQARQLQHRHGRRRGAGSGRPRAVHGQEAVGRVHADPAVRARDAAASPPSTPRTAARSSRSCARSSRTRSSSSRSTSPT